MPRLLRPCALLLAVDMLMIVPAVRYSLISVTPTDRVVLTSSERSRTQIDTDDLFPLMAHFATDREPGVMVLVALFPGE